MKKFILFILSLPLMMLCGCEEDIISRNDLNGTWKCIDYSEEYYDGELILHFRNGKITCENSLVNTYYKDMDDDMDENVAVGYVNTWFDLGGGTYCSCYKVKGSLMYLWHKRPCEDFIRTAMPIGEKPTFNVSYDGDTLLLEQRDDIPSFGHLGFYYRFVKL